MEGSTAFASATLASSDLLGDVPSRNRMMFCAAAEALNGVPSVNLTSVRSFIVSTVLSALYDQLVASHGTTFAAGVSWSSESYAAWMYGDSFAQLAFAAAMVVGGTIAPRVSVPVPLALPPPPLAPPPPAQPVSTIPRAAVAAVPAIRLLFALLVLFVVSTSGGPFVPVHLPSRRLSREP